MPSLRGEDMATVTRKLGINVLEAAKERIRNVFSNGVPVALSSSGGKDSIVMMSLVYDMITAGEIDGSLLTVDFIDEEVIYEEVRRICEQWRKKFMLIGVKYNWWCIEHRNNNCFNALENNENFIPWDRYEKENWAYEMPKFALTDSPYLVKRTENYQDFLVRKNRGSIAIIGVRAAESINRRQYLAKINSGNGGLSSKNIMYPIYDWTDEDVWKYIKDRGLDFPDVYIHMYEAGIGKKNLRVCNLFAIDTAKSMTVLFEIYPELWQKVLKREPNAYLVRLYWDTEMFHRSTIKKRKLEEGIADDKDYRKLFMEVVNNPEKYFRNPHALKVARQYRSVVLKMGGIMEEKHYKALYESIMAGDTKTRNLRAIKSKIYTDYIRSEGVQVVGDVKREE